MIRTNCLVSCSLERGGGLCCPLLSSIDWQGLYEGWNQNHCVERSSLDEDITGYGTGTVTVPIFVILIRFSFRDSLRGVFPPPVRGVEWENDWLFLGVDSGAWSTLGFLIKDKFVQFLDFLNDLKSGSWILKVNCLVMMESSIPTLRIQKFKKWNLIQDLSIQNIIQFIQHRSREISHALHRNHGKCFLP